MDDFMLIRASNPFEWECCFVYFIRRAEALPQLVEVGWNRLVASAQRRCVERVETASMHWAVGFSPAHPAPM